MIRPALLWWQGMLLLFIIVPNVAAARRAMECGLHNFALFHAFDEAYEANPGLCAARYCQHTEDVDCAIGAWQGNSYAVRGFFQTRRAFELEHAAFRRVIAQFGTGGPIHRRRECDVLAAAAAQTTGDGADDDEAIPVIIDLALRLDRWGAVCVPRVKAAFPQTRASQAALRIGGGRCLDTPSMCAKQLGSGAYGLPALAQLLPDKPRAAEDCWLQRGDSPPAPFYEAFSRNDGLCRTTQCRVIMDIQCAAAVWSNIYLPNSMIYQTEVARDTDMRAYQHALREFPFRHQSGEALVCRMLAEVATKVTGNAEHDDNSIAILFDLAARVDRVWPHCTTQLRPSFPTSVTVQDEVARADPGPRGRSMRGK